MVSVQAEGCAPIVRAFREGAEKARPWEGAKTVADGLRVPRAIGDFLILRAVRESGGTALAVPDAAMVKGMLDIGKHQGVSAAPEGGAALVAIERLVADGSIKKNAVGRPLQHRRRVSSISTSCIKGRASSAPTCPGGAAPTCPGGVGAELAPPSNLRM